MKEEFVSKAASMRAWIPHTPPSNRDRLELYSLHKQAASGDCPANAASGKGSGADKAKFEAWKTKRGLTQAEAMSRYISECERQLRVYGSKGGPSTTTMENTSDSPANPNAPTQASKSTESSLRGIQSVPLLASAASEPMGLYTQRLSLLTSPSASWWSKQVPLCSPSVAEPPLSYRLESMLISVGSFLERTALTPRALGPVPSTVLYSMLFPLHVLLLTYWIALIYLLSLPATLYLVVKTLLFGSVSTGATLEDVIADTITPTASTATALLQSNNLSAPIRFLAVLLTPLTITTDVAVYTQEVAGPVVASVAYTLMVACTWWYYIFVMPWMMGALGWASGMYGVCLGVIEYSGV